MPLLATAIWLLWVLGKQTGSDGVISTLSFLLAVGIACWLIDKGFSLQSTAARRRITATVALALVAGAYFAFPERHLKTLSAGLDGEGAAVADATTVLRTDGEIEWRPFSVARVEELAAQNKTIFVDFTADWCLTCKPNETAIFASKKVQKAFKDIVDVCIKGQTKILSEFGIKYDSFDYESKYLWTDSMAKILKEYEKKLKLFIDEDGRKVLDQSEFKLAMRNPVLVLTRADGTSLYPLRDIAYALDIGKKGKNIVVLGEDQKLYNEQVNAALLTLEKNQEKQSITLLCCWMRARCPQEKAT